MWLITASFLTFLRRDKNLDPVSGSLEWSPDVNDSGSSVYIHFLLLCCVSPCTLVSFTGGSLEPLNSVASFLGLLCFYFKKDFWSFMHWLDEV